MLGVDTQDFIGWDHTSSASGNRHSRKDVVFARLPQVRDRTIESADCLVRVSSHFDTPMVRVAAFSAKSDIRPDYRKLWSLLSALVYRRREVAYNSLMNSSGA